jgi:UDP-N-acetyl-2-amino-2-deoxyglucuronate dehydrogenase
VRKNSKAELVAVCDIDETLRNKVPNINFYADYQEMIEREALDVVHICLPHFLHYPVTKYCLEKGLHVFLEKPLGLDSKEGYALVELEEKYENTKICVCLQNRYNESFEKLKKMINSGVYGKIIGVKGLVTWYRPKSYYEAKPWHGQLKDAGGGVMINQSLHTIDLIQLLGGEIKSIKGTVNQLLDYGIEVEDTVAANIEFVNGAKGLFFATNANAANSSVELQVLL